MVLVGLSRSLPTGASSQSGLDIAGMLPELCLCCARGVFFDCCWSALDRYVSAPEVILECSYSLHASSFSGLSGKGSAEILGLWFGTWRVAMGC